MTSWDSEGSSEASGRILWALVDLTRVIAKAVQEPSFLPPRTMAERKLVWATISTSAQHTVAYLQSTFATSDADILDSQTGEYLAIVRLSTKPPRLHDSAPNGAVAWLVQPVTDHDPLPPSYIPIFPCRLGSREPLVPEFEWPFGECILDTSTTIAFTAVFLGGTPRTLSADASRTLSAFLEADDRAHWKRDCLERVASRKAQREAAGLVGDDSRWTSFSRSSTTAELPPDAFFAPVQISVWVRFGIASLKKQLLAARQILEDERKVKLLRARFSHPQADRTIVWTLNQATSLDGYSTLRTAVEARSPTVAHLEFSANFDRSRIEDTSSAPQHCLRGCPRNESTFTDSF
ncbi:hypothetical protein B0H12DRAFT_1135916 [Mycena haematopus]|nr:hypothetical protein B0H12DRAFT_1135916 [Mycena haematopus]